jgi:hypothetical protein
MGRAIGRKRERVREREREREREIKEYRGLKHKLLKLLTQY